MKFQNWWLQFGDFVVSCRWSALE